MWVVFLVLLVKKKWECGIGLLRPPFVRSFVSSTGRLSVALFPTSITHATHQLRSEFITVAASFYSLRRIFFVFKLGLKNTYIDRMVQD